MLTQAPTLNVLEAYVGSHPWLPPLANLRHLVLEFYHDFGNISCALAGAVALQTASLRGRGSYNTAPPLLLDRLLQLKVLVLRKVTPRRLELPPSCCLHLQDYGDLNMKARVWETVLSSVRGISVLVSGFHNGVIFEKLRLDFLNPLQNLSIVAIRYEPAFGCVGATLNLKPLAHLRKVAVSGVSLGIFLPARVSWEQASFDASKDLTLSFADMNAFVSAVPRFAASGTKMRDDWKDHFCCALKRQGIAWASRKGTSLIYNFWYPARLGTLCRSCCGGACMDCLAAAGKAVAQEVAAQVAADVTTQRRWNYH